MNAPRAPAAGRGEAPEGPEVPGPEALARAILQGLAEGRYVPGQRLAEPDLMAVHGVGRSTVREALGRLAAAGLVVLAPHRGAAIRRLTRREADDVLRVVRLLLGLLAGQAAEAVAAGADPAPLLAAARAHAEAPDDRARARYYRALTRLAGNAELERLLPLVQVQLVRAQTGLRRHAGQRTRMVAAIAAGDAAGAEAAAHGHVEALRRALAGLPEAAFAPARSG